MHRLWWTWIHYMWLPLLKLAERKTSKLFLLKYIAILLAWSIKPNYLHLKWKRTVVCRVVAEQLDACGAGSPSPSLPCPCSPAAAAFPSASGTQFFHSVLILAPGSPGTAITADSPKARLWPSHQSSLPPPVWSFWVTPADPRTCLHEAYGPSSTQPWAQHPPININSIVSRNLREAWGKLHTQIHSKWQLNFKQSLTCY